MSRLSCHLPCRCSWSPSTRRGCSSAGAASRWASPSSDLYTDERDCTSTRRLPISPPSSDSLYSQKLSLEDNARQRRCNKSSRIAPRRPACRVASRSVASRASTHSWRTVASVHLQAAGTIVLYHVRIDIRFRIPKNYVTLPKSGFHLIYTGIWLTQCNIIFGDSESDIDSNPNCTRLDLSVAA